MCETDFKDFSFLAMASSGEKTGKPVQARVRDGLREN